MQIRLVSIAPSEAATEAGVPALSPELMAAVGARYSRNDEGLDAILSLVNRLTPDKSIDTIFKMVDYGHQSIADMAPVAMFLDGVSIWLTYYIWSICPRASGQETSTRYVKFGMGGIVSPDLTGISDADRTAWNDFLHGAIDRYTRATDFWERLATAKPGIMGLPSSLLVEAKKDPEGKAGKQIARMRRNYVFDRARYWIPTAAVTNFMLVMAARDWVALAQTLLSHPLPEAVAVGERIFDQLRLIAPRLIHHARPTDDRRAGHLADMRDDASLPFDWQDSLDPNVNVHVDDNVLLRRGSSAPDAFAHHSNRYSWIGREAHRVHVRYSISALAIAELRDLNRHRPGYKYAPMVPVGFYGAADQLPAHLSSALDDAIEFGQAASKMQRKKVAAADPTNVYWGLLGTQIPYEHGTTLDKLAYQIALRTGLGAHYRYAAHMRLVHDRLVEQIPGLAGLLLLGSAEPE
jgi:thymidylate synthase ThyX